jgi:putative ATP-dependent endonuclease of the OLD family
VGGGAIEHTLQHHRVPVPETVRATNASERADLQLGDETNMRLVRLRVERFRGIRSLDWIVPDRVVCLVGPGDSGKSTVLDAISMAVSPRNTVSFTDDDFFKGTAAEGFSLEATFADLPDGISLLGESRFGLLLGGVDSDGELHAEPGDHEPTITVRLDVDPNLEPTWRVVTASNPEGRLIGPGDRAALGVAFVGSNPDRQFTWARGSALARASGEDVSGILLDVYREMRDALENIDLKVLDETVSMVRTSGTRMGAGPVTSDLGIGIDLVRK